jgi:Cu(I)/Ag(I) efflux system membrane fusion protein
MKHVVPLLALTALCLVSTLARADVASDIVAPYLRIQTGLADDSLAPVAADAAQIVAAANKLGAPAKTLSTTAAELQQTSDLEGAREAFGRLSTALIEYSESTETALGPDINVAHCPMVEKSWVQKGNEIANPYAGMKMKSCGEIVKPAK